MHFSLGKKILFWKLEKQIIVKKKIVQIVEG